MDLLGVTSFFEDEAAVPAGGNPSSTILSIWTGIDWTFENRSEPVTSTGHLRSHGANNVPTAFQGIVTGPSGSQVWSNGSLGSNFASQLNGILSGGANKPLCNGLADSLAVAVGVTSGYLANNVPGALQFASGGVVPGHGAGVTENPVAGFGNGNGRFTFYQPIYPPLQGAAAMNSLRWVVAGILWLLFGVALAVASELDGTWRGTYKGQPTTLMPDGTFPETITAFELRLHERNGEITGEFREKGKKADSLLSQERERNSGNRACFDILLDSEDMRWCVQVRRNQLIGAWSKGPEGGPLLGGAGPGSTPLQN